MRKRGMCFLAAAMVCLAWTVLPMEDTETIELARVLYHHCAQQPDETMRLFGSAVMNRVGQRGYGDTLLQVLKEYPSTPVYDQRTLECARALCEGWRSFDAAPQEVVHAVHKEADQSAYASLGFWRVSGDYVFYYQA